MFECLTSNPFFAGVGIWLLVIGVLGFFTMGIDKTRARYNEWRVSEITLFLMALFGGFWGVVLGMQLFHHKTSKLSFILVVYAISASWIILLTRLGFTGCIVSGITHP